MKSDTVKNGLQQAPHRSLFYALGMTEEEMNRPLVGIVNSYNELVPGHMNLDKITEAVRKGVLMAGGTPVVFPAIAVCDGIAMGHVGMKYSLVTRELIADSTESMALAHQLDALVMIPNCDKNVPGLLMAAARVNVPTIFVSGGPMLAGRVNGQKKSLSAMFEGIYGESIYKSPTDMGVNMAGFCIVDDDAVCRAAKQEIIRRYYNTVDKVVIDEASEEEVFKIQLIMKQAKITTDDRPVTVAAKKRAEETGLPSAAIELADGTIITSKTSDFLGASAALLLNALKYLAGVSHDVRLITPEAIVPIQDLKVRFLHGKNPRLHTDEVLIALALASRGDLNARESLEQIPRLKGCQVHTSVMLTEVDRHIFHRLGVDLTSEPVSSIRKW